VGLAGLAIARILKLPVSGAYHASIARQVKASTEDEYVSEMVSKCLLWFYDQLDAVYVFNEAAREELEAKGINPDKIRVGAYGVNHARFHPRHRNGFLQERCPGAAQAVSALCVGPLSREYGMHHLCRAYKDVLARGIDLRLVIEGHGPGRAEMERLLAGTPAFFFDEADRDQLPALYAACDYFVQPGGADPFDNALLEAQASGLPVIVTDAGLRENMRPGETGVVVPADDVEALSEAMAALASDQGRRERMGRAARTYAESRGHEEAFSRLYAMYVNEDVTSARNDFAEMIERFAPTDVLAS
jgi:glycosyltransferase involved in cell wall biosynthesis